MVELTRDSPPDLESNEDVEGIVTVALSHSALELKGYELVIKLVIKQLVDPDNNEWNDFKTKSVWHSSGTQ